MEHVLPEKKSKSLILYSSYLPMLLLLVLVLGITSLIGARSLSTKNNEGSVLSKDSDSGSDEGSDENDNDDNDDDSIENEVDDDDDNDGILDSDEDKSGNSNEKQKTIQTITNPDGTTSEIKREVKKDGEIKLEIRTFDAEGNKIMVEKFE